MYYSMCTIKEHVLLAGIMYNVYCNYFECSPYAFQIIASGSKAEQQGPCDNTYEPPE